MHQRRAAGGKVVEIGLGCLRAMGQQSARPQHPQPVQPEDGAGAVLLLHQPQFGGRLAAVLAHRRAQFGGKGGGALQKRGRAGLDPVGGEHGADQPARAPLDPGGKAVTILGTVDGNGDPTSILDGGNLEGGSNGVRVLICQSGETSTTVFQNLVIQNGYAGDGGGMVNDNGSNPTLTNCTFTGNSARYTGGGMWNDNSSSPTLTDCTFTSNSVTDFVGRGGGMYNLDGSSPTLTGCTFTSNSVEFNGGGMYNTVSSSPTLTDCTFTGNSANRGGAGMYNFDSSPTLTECTFTNNSAGYDGGGMLNYYDSSPTLTNCTFTNNSVSENGGGMLNGPSCSPTLTDCTFMGNSATGDGGGMWNNPTSSRPTLTNCNFCGNTSGTGNRNINGSIDGSSSGNRLLLNCNTGDVNFDLQIDSGDLGYLLALWGASSVLNADINQDGEVNGADLAYILSHFGGATDDTTAD